MNKEKLSQPSNASPAPRPLGFRGFFSRLICKLRNPKPRIIEKTIWCPNRKRECAAKFEVEGTIVTRIKDVTECPAMEGYEKSCDRACMAKIKCEDA